MASTLKKNGYTNFFLGPRSNQYLGSFERVYEIGVGRYFNIVFDRRLHNRWLSFINMIQPDVIIAHDVIAAKFLIGSELPVVYDDREFWSKSIETQAGRSLTPAHRIRSTPFRNMVPIWERKLISNFPTLVTHEAVAKHHRKFGRWIGVAWNYPLLTMVDNLNLDEARQGSVYSGCDFRSGKFKTHRDMTGLKKHIKFDVICGVSHREMMEQLTHYRVGLTPWHPHPVLPFKDQNRNYEYLHAGLQVVLNEQLKIRFKNCDYVHSFKDYLDLQDVIDSLPNQDPHEISDYARANYIWEFNEQVIIEAVNQAVS
ncbi:MAG: hypothetical protein ACFFD8_05935 [Candidatus Thorarchaeota archaeon]